MTFANLVQLSAILGISAGALALLIVIAVWDGVWKLIALWKSARNNHLIWFIFLAVLNTAGILPIIYIFGFSMPKKAKKKRKR